MVFSEIYSAYYNTVSIAIREAQKGTLSPDSLFRIVRESAFPESVTTIIPSLEKGKWALIKSDFTTALRFPPTMPLSELQRRWLKSICLDKRFRLFVRDEDIARIEKNLAETEPLFLGEFFFLYDKYSDGDPYDDEQYAVNFRTVMESIRSGKKLSVEYECAHGRVKKFCFAPGKIEYSQKDDKFRIVSKIRSTRVTMNIARIRKCEIAENGTESAGGIVSKPCSVTLEIRDERNALERVMMAFAHFEKSCAKTSGGTYQLTVTYDASDETELVIRVLSFGPMVRAVEPEPFVRLVRERIGRQVALMEEAGQTEIQTAPSS